MAAATKTNAVKAMIIVAKCVPLITGEIRNMINGAIFTIVDECSKALTGVGATMAPINHLLNGY